MVVGELDFRSKGRSWQQGCDSGELSVRKVGGSGIAGGSEMDADFGLGARACSLLSSKRPEP